MNKVTTLLLLSILVVSFAKDSTSRFRRSMVMGHSCSHPPTLDKSECAKRTHGLFENKPCHFCQGIFGKVEQFDKRSGTVNRCVAHHENCAYTYDECSDPPTLHSWECAKRTHGVPNDRQPNGGQCYHCSGFSNFDFTKFPKHNNRCVGDKDRCLNDGLALWDQRQKQKAGGGVV